MSNREIGYCKFKDGDRQACNAYYNRCIAAKAPYVTVTVRKNRAQVDYDYITLPEAIEYRLYLHEWLLKYRMRDIYRKCADHQSECASAGATVAIFRNVRLDRAEEAARQIHAHVAAVLAGRPIVKDLPKLKTWWKWFPVIAHRREVPLTFDLIIPDVPEKGGLCRYKNIDVDAIAKMAQKAVDGHTVENHGRPPTPSVYERAAAMPEAAGGEVIMVPLSLIHGANTKITIQLPRSLVVLIDNMAKDDGATRRDYIKEVLAQWAL